MKESLDVVHSTVKNKKKQELRQTAGVQDQD